MANNAYFLLVAFGTYGDLHPMMALGLALQQRGAAVTLASHPEYRAKVEAAGLTFRNCGLARDAYIERLDMGMEAIVERTARDVAFMFEHLVAPGIVSGVEDILPDAQTTDIVIGTSLAYAGDIAAQLAGKPFVAVALQPTILMSAWDPPKVPEAPFALAPTTVFGRLWNRLLIAGASLYLDRGLRPIRAVYSHFGLEPKFTVSGVTSEHMTLALFSPLMAVAQRDWPVNTRVAGTPFYDSEDGRTPVLPPVLAAFLDSGPPPLVF
ncbi:MAG: glycosyltransferase, partial [Asticcacaulis sp.]|nr:glycosyltransferase [Asticcacaulis sp.]